MKIREKKNKLLGVPIMCSNTAKDYQNFLPSVRQEKTRSRTGRESCCLATKQNESELKTLNSTFAKGQKFACDARKGQCANQQLTHTSRTSSDQHAQTPNTRVEATSPGICDKPCHQQPRNAGRQPASTMLAAYKLGTEHHETVLPLITSDHKLCPEEEDCPADNRERRNTTTTNNHATPSRGCHGRDETVDRETETGKKPKPREDNYDNVS